MSTLSERGTLPLVVGVTGHRDLRPDDLPLLRERVRAALRDLRAEVPHTPLLFLSPLAEGADRLAAEVALEEGGELLVPLPMPSEEYEEDFPDPASRAAFRALLDRAAEVLVVPSDPASRREDRYRAASAWIVRRANVLLALWDGLPSKRAGDTAEVVRLMLEGPSVGALEGGALDPADVGPVLHITTPRQREEGAPGTPGELRTLFPGEEPGAQVAQPTLAILDRYNAEIADDPGSLDERARRSRANLALGEDLGGAAAVLVQRYAVADALALRYQARRRVALVAMSVLGLVAVTSWILFDDFPLPEDWAYRLLVAYHLFLGVAFALFLLADRRSWAKKHLDYRALAEGMRVLIAWRAAGIDDDVASNYLLRQHSVTNWIRLALRITDAQAGYLRPLGEDSLRHVLRTWVEDQLAYYARAAHENQSVQRRMRRTGRVLVIAAFGASLAILAGFRFDGSMDSVKPILVGTIGLCFGLAGAMDAYLEKTATREQSRQYAGMRELFARASGRLSALLDDGNLRGARALVLELGREALEENALWLQFRRARPLESPHGD